jgi:hypothetical protein
MDCLDRTNVVQSTLARYVMTTQLQELGILKEDQKLEDQTDFMTGYRNSKYIFGGNLYFIFLVK